MTDQGLLQAKKRIYSQVAEMARETDIATIEICAAGSRDGAVRSTKTFAIGSVNENALTKKIVAGHMEKAAMQTVVVPWMVEPVSDALLKCKSYIALIVTIVLNYVEKESSRVENKEEFLGCRKEICEPSQSLPASHHLDDDNTPSKEEADVYAIARRTKTNKLCLKFAGDETRSVVTKGQV